MEKEKNPLRFLVDESSGKKLHEYLLRDNHDSKYVGDLIPSASDEDVLKIAKKENRILITNDKDFGELIFRLYRNSSGVIFLRLRNDSPENRQRYVSAVIKNLSNKLIHSFVIVNENQIRVRDL